MEIHSLFVKCHERKGDYQIALDYLKKNEKFFLD